MSVGDGGSPGVANNTRLPIGDRDQGHVPGGSARPTRVEHLVWLAASVCGITPLQVLTDRTKPGPLARHMIAAWLHDYDGWAWPQIADVLGKSESTVRQNHVHFRGKLKGANGPAPIYEVFWRRARILWES